MGVAPGKNKRGFCTLESKAYQDLCYPKIIQQAKFPVNANRCPSGKGLWRYSSEENLKLQSEKLYFPQDFRFCVFLGGKSPIKLLISLSDKGILFAQGIWKVNAVQRHAGEYWDSFLINFVWKAANKNLTKS